MLVQRLWLRDFRSYATAELTLSDGLTVVQGRNGVGKTNVLEALGYLASLKSFRGAPNEAMVRMGAERAIVRGEAVVERREVLLEAEISPTGRGRTLVNKQPLRRARDLLGVLRVSVFSPDDLILVKGGPGERRDWLDDALIAMHAKHGQSIDELDRVVRQRNALLKQVGGRLNDSAALTLDVWDAKLTELGTTVALDRTALLARMAPILAMAYDDIAEAPLPVGVQYASSWWSGEGGLGGALERGRSDDVRRGVSLVGPHRDDVALTLGVRPSRTHASQGEQRTLALAMRLAVHRLVAEELGWTPVLLLDDVFSELDPNRSAALVRNLPVGQALLATATDIPAGMAVASIVDVELRPDGSTTRSRQPGDKPVDSVDEIAQESAR